MVGADLIKKVAICGAAVSVIGAAFFHHRIQGDQLSDNLVNTYHVAKWSPAGSNRAKHWQERCLSRFKNACKPLKFR